METIRFGYCCQNLTIPSRFRSTTITWLRKNPNLAKNKILEIVQNNLNEFVKILNWNIQNKIFVFRLTSDFIPAADHPEFEHIWHELLSLDIWKDAQIAVLEYIKLGGRIGTHPAQFTVISSERPEVVAQSIKHLQYHADLLSKLGLPENHYFGINIHVSNGSKFDTACSNTMRSIDKLPQNVRNRLTFETEESGCWTWQNLLNFPVPIVLDFHHHRINNRGDSWQEAFDACTETWKQIRPLTHYSEGRDHPLDTKHSDFLETVPTNFVTDTELECKKKDLAILFLRKSQILC